MARAGELVLENLLEGRVLPQLRQREELGILAHGTQLPQAQTIEGQTRPVPYAPDLISGDVPACDESLAAASGKP